MGGDRDDQLLAKQNLYQNVTKQRTIRAPVVQDLQPYTTLALKHAREERNALKKKPPALRWRPEELTPSESSSVSGSSSSDSDSSPRGKKKSKAKKKKSKKKKDKTPAAITDGSQAVATGIAADYKNQLQASASVASAGSNNMGGGGNNPN